MSEQPVPRFRLLQCIVDVSMLSLSLRWSYYDVHFLSFIIINPIYVTVIQSERSGTYKTEKLFQLVAANFSRILADLKYTKTVFVTTPSSKKKNGDEDDDIMMATPSTLRYVSSLIRLLFFLCCFYDLKLQCCYSVWVYKILLCEMIFG